MQPMLLLIICFVIKVLDGVSGVPRRRRSRPRRAGRLGGRQERPWDDPAPGSIAEAYEELGEANARAQGDAGEGGDFRRQIRRKSTTIIPWVISSEETRYGKTIWAWPRKAEDKKKDFYIYDPTAGYEPYWLDGHWVFEGENVTTTIGPNCPYAECPPPYILFGAVCAVDKNSKKKTFETYCDMLLDDCDFNKQHMMVYRGNCNEIYTGQMVQPAAHVHSANSWMLEWYEHSPTTLTWTHHTTKRIKLAKPDKMDIKAP